MKYRVITKRWDMDDERHHFDAASDEEAKRIFEEKFCKAINYSWDYLTFYRIDVEEKTTHMGGRGNSDKEAPYYHV